jgi:hypothetical protein
MKPRHAAALALVRVGIVISFVAIPVGALFFKFFGPFNEFSNGLIWLAELPNALVEIPFNRWMTVDNKLLWLIVLSAFPIIVWGVAGLFVARRTRTL